MKEIVPIEAIERKILLIRGHKVMLSTDLAQLYDVEPRALVQAVKRNIVRFPEDFMFQLSMEEFTNLKSQIVIPHKFDAIRQLMASPEPREKKIGFRVRERIARYGTSSR